MPIVTVAGDKGGIGKTAIALELAAALPAVLVDLDWSGGSASGTWGHRAGKVNRLVRAMRPGALRPLPLRAPGRPGLVPSHPDLAEIASGWDGLPANLRRWSASWGESVVVDTHPGLNYLTLLALQAADLVVVPVVLRERELNALEAMLHEGLASYQLLLVPNMVPPVTPAPQFVRLRRILAPYPKVQVAPAIGLHPFWARRRSRAAIATLPRPGRQAARLQGELLEVAEAVRSLL